MSTQTPILNILIVKLSSLGDVIHALPVAHNLKKILPECRISWLVHKPLGDIIRLFPCVDEVIDFDRNYFKRAGNLKELYTPLKLMMNHLKTQRFDWVIDLQGLLRSGLWSFVSGAKLRIGFENARECAWLFYNLKIPVEKKIHALDQNLAVLKHLFPAETDYDFNLQLRKSDHESIVANMTRIQPHFIPGQFALIFPGTRWVSKQWPFSQFRDLIEQTSSLMPVVIAGTEEDRKAIAVTGLKEHVNILNLCGKTSVSELLLLIQNARIVVTNDSGPMHMAALLKIPLIALLGPTAKWKTGPYRHGRVLQKNFDCIPCLKKDCPLTGIEYKKCMNTISPSEVFEELRQEVK